MSGPRAAGRQIAAVLRSPLAVATAIAAAASLLVISIWLPNLGLIWRVAVRSHLSMAGRLRFLWDSLGALATNFTPMEATLTIAVCVLFGLTVAVTVRTLRTRPAPGSAGGLGLAGAAVGLLGAGCSTCGAVLLSSLVGAGASASFVASLPLHGLELSIASLLLLATALLLTASSAARSAACAIPRPPASPPPTSQRRPGSAGD